MKRSHASSLFFLSLSCGLVGVFVLSGCGRDKAGRQKEQDKAQSSSIEEPHAASREGSPKIPKGVASPPIALPTDAARLQRRWQVEPPLTDSAGALDRSWTRPSRGQVVVLGRGGLYFGGQAPIPLRCRLGGQPCPDLVARGPVGRQRYTFSEQHLSPPERGLGVGHALIRALRPLAKAQANKAVVVVADRRVDFIALHQVLHTLRSGGAIPILTALDKKGRLVALGEDRAWRGQRAWSPGPKAPRGGGIPRELRAVQVDLYRGGARLRLIDASQRVLEQVVQGEVSHGLQSWARRILSARAGVRGIELRVEAGVSWDEVVRAVDALRDLCPAATGSRGCVRQERLFAVIELRWLGEDERPVALEGASDLEGESAGFLRDSSAQKPAVPIGAGLSLRGGASAAGSKVRYLRPGLPRPAQEFGRGLRPGTLLPPGSKGRP